MRTTIDLDDEVERIARAKAGAELRSLSDIVNEALRHYLPGKMVIKYGTTGTTSIGTATISQMGPNYKATSLDKAPKSTFKPYHTTAGVPVPEIDQPDGDQGKDMLKPDKSFENEIKLVNGE